ncbi:MULTISPECIES: hypothetical protein [Thermomonosporaceae]|uniref:hypothetical protein n=1 Tax=Thermomonosporaceae TaxID=2012 RepID=UPI00255AEA1A|nr:MULTISPECIES: hypothetical protein [Thermomonosporaceae]MDL4774558.1 hypothetical protein [Actinomadura xylanilytica]
MASERKKILLRLDPAVHDALARWAGDELRSTNAQIEFLLRGALAEAGRMPGTAGRMRRPGRPSKESAEPPAGDGSGDGPRNGTGDGPGEGPSSDGKKSED